MKLIIRDQVQSRIGTIERQPTKANKIDFGLDDPTNQPETEVEVQPETWGEQNEWMPVHLTGVQCRQTYTLGIANHVSANHPIGS